MPGLELLFVVSVVRSQRTAGAGFGSASATGTGLLKPRQAAASAALVCSRIFG